MKLLFEISQSKNEIKSSDLATEFSTELFTKGLSNHDDDVPIEKYISQMHLTARLMIENFHSLFSTQSFLKLICDNPSSFIYYQQKQNMDDMNDDTDSDTTSTLSTYMNSFSSVVGGAITSVGYNNRQTQSIQHQKKKYKNTTRTITLSSKCN
jgi:hypothetical protein